MNVETVQLGNYGFPLSFGAIGVSFILGSMFARNFMGWLSNGLFFGGLTLLLTGLVLVEDFGALRALLGISSGLLIAGLGFAGFQTFTDTTIRLASWKGIGLWVLALSNAFTFTMGMSHLP